MSFIDALKNIGVPVVTAITAAMVAILNFQMSAQDAAMREQLQHFETVLKEAQEQRQERESHQSFSFRIYDIVVKSIEEDDPRKQEVATAFVVVMVEEPLRTSLLNVLKQGGTEKVKQEVGQILAAEQRFVSKTSSVEPVKVRAEKSSYPWQQWDIDLFWCSTSGEQAKTDAGLIAEQLLAEDASGRIRIRELPESINAKSGYQIDGYAIRYSSDELQVAKALQYLSDNVLSSQQAKGRFNLTLTTQKTPWYLSVFLCPAQ